MFKNHFDVSGHTKNSDVIIFELESTFQKCYGLSENFVKKFIGEDILEIFLIFMGAQNSHLFLYCFLTYSIIRAILVLFG